jgi:hypothetical protein
MGIDKLKFAKLLAISEGLKGKKEESTKDKPKLSNDITFPRLVITFSIFFFLLYIIVSR